MASWSASAAARRGGRGAGGYVDRERSRETPGDLSDLLPPFVYVPCELPPAEVETMMPVTRPLDAGGTGLILYTALDRLRQAQGRDRHWAVLNLPSLSQLQDLRRYEAFLIDDGLDESDRAHA